MKKLLSLVLAAVLVLSLVGSAMAADYVPGVKLGDVRVRQALLYALDRANFIEAEYGTKELARVGLAPLSPTSWAFPEESELNAYPYDLEKANALLDEAGWVMGADGIREKDGTKLSLRWLVYTDSTWPGTLSSMAYDSWKKIGVDLKIELMDFNTVSARTMDAKPGEKDFDIYTMGFSLSLDPDPTGALFDYGAFTEGGFNASGFYDEHSQDLIARGKATFDTEERKAIYQEWAKLMNELVPTTIVAYRSEIWGINQRVKGLEMNSFAKFPYFLNKVTLEGDQILKFGESSFDGVFNPIMADNVYDDYIVASLFSSLVNNDENGEFFGDIATWELSEDNLTYTFTLKDGVCFSDGKALTTQDVYFTYATIAKPEYNGPRTYAVDGIKGYKAFNAGETETFEGIKVIDDKTISFTCDVASPANIERFIYGIMDDEYYAYTNWDEFMAKVDEPYGSGRMVFGSYAPSEYVSLTTNENYWDKEDGAKIAGIYVSVVPDDSKIAALTMGEIDFAQLTAKKDNVFAIEELPDVNLLSYLGNGYTFMCFNTLN